MTSACALFLFTACNEDGMAPQDMTLSAQNIEETHRSNTLNFNKDIMSLNNSGVTGTATLTLEENMLTVHMMASGLEPGMVHRQYIHCFPDNNQNASALPCQPIWMATDLWS